RQVWRQPVQPWVWPQKLAAQLPCPESPPIEPERPQRSTPMPLVNPWPNQLLNLLPNPAPLIVFDSDRLAVPALAPRLWPEPVEPKISWDLAPESAAAPFRRRPAHDQ